MDYFNSRSLKSVEGVIDPAEHTRSPAIIDFNGEWLAELPGTCSGRRRHGALRDHLQRMFERAWVKQAIHAGFNVVIPADPQATLADYTRRVKRLTSLAHAQSVAAGAEFVAATGDRLAVSVRNEEIKLQARAALDLSRLETVHKRFTCRLTMLVLCCGLAACELPVDTAEGNLSSGSKTIGLVLSGFDHLFYVTEDGKEECPDGLVHSSKENWHVQFPTRAARKAQFDKCGGIDNRGPDCENVLVAPESVRDPLPYREVKGAKSYGSNLDGTEEGQETSTTCKHRKFVHPDGTKGIDNQYYRLLGCQKIVHSGGLLASDTAQHVIRQIFSVSRSRRILLEIQDIDDEQNDEHVEVVFYRGKDTLAVDGEGDAVPWQSQRVDEDTLPPQYLRGRIVHGELITEPADVTSNVVSFFGERPILVRGARFQLRLTETGAEGMRTGYVDAASWWRDRRATNLAGSFTGDSPPALYEALRRLADGYRDPETGACTALSSATKLEFVRAYVRHPDKSE